MNLTKANIQIIPSEVGIIGIVEDNLYIKNTREIASEYGVDRKTIYNILHNKTWKE